MSPAEANTPDLIFGYIRDLIYEPHKAKLDYSTLDPRYRDVGEGLTVLGGMLIELRRYAEDLAKGDMHTEIPSRDNELASALKSLHASLCHVAWQTQRVAEGDFEQKIDFMGDFADSFNSMVRELQARDKIIQHQIEEDKVRSQALENSVKLFMTLTEKIPQAMAVLALEDQEILFSNVSARELFDEDEGFLTSLKGVLVNDIIEGSDRGRAKTFDIHIGEGASERFFLAHRYFIGWGSKDAAAFTAEDVTEDRLRTRKLEILANVDELTKLYVRRYGMEVYEQWIRERRRFSLVFVDLDFLKYVNDTFGHELGDAYITTAARLLKDLEHGTVATRLGGDEFMLLVPDLTSEEIVPLMDGVQLALARAPQEMETDDETRAKLKFHASFGIVDVPTDGTADPSALLAEADERMYRYKKAHKAERKV